MAGLINIVSEYSSRLAILPIFAIIMGAVSVFLYFFNERRIVKYIPAFGSGILAIIIAIISMATFTSKAGLNLAWIAIFLASASIFGIIVAYATELIFKIKADMKDLDKQDPIEGSNKKRVAKKRQASRKSSKKEA